MNTTTTIRIRWTTRRELGKIMTKNKLYNLDHTIQHLIDQHELSQITKK